MDSGSLHPTRDCIEPQRLGLGQFSCALRFLVAGCAVLSTATGWGEDSSRVSVADRITAVKGSVSATTSKGDTEKAKPGAVVPWGGLLQTHASSAALLSPLPQVKIVMFPLSKMRFDRGALARNSGQKSDAHYTLLEGKVSVSVPPGAGGSSPASSGKTPRNVLVSDKTKRPAEPSRDKVVVCTSRAEVSTANGVMTVEESPGKTLLAVIEGQAGVTVGGCEGMNLVDVGAGSVITLQTDPKGEVTGQLVNTVTGNTSTINSNGTLAAGSATASQGLTTSRSVIGGPLAPDGLLPSPGGLPPDPTAANTPDFSAAVPQQTVASPQQP